MSTGASAMVSGIRITHPDRIVYPDLKIAKVDVARYYERIGDWMVPHVARRPLTLVHCPEGIAAPCRYLRHGKAWGPLALRRVNIREKTKTGEYLVADDLAGIVSLAQMGVLEIHTWNSTTDDIERPNRIIWDLDPGPAVKWADVVRAARRVRQLMHALDLETWVKTTGGKGLHIVLPMLPRLDWSACLSFARDVAAVLVRSDPDRFTTTYSKLGRESKILIDYLRNNRTNTSVAAFSTRARPGAPISMPIAWDELGPKLRPDAFTVLTAPRRLARLRRDPWADYWTCRQRVSAAAINALSRI